MTRTARKYPPDPSSRLENALLFIAGVVMVGLAVVWPLTFFIVAIMSGRLELAF